jgi:hypothetical protein
VRWYKYDFLVPHRTDRVRYPLPSSSSSSGDGFVSPAFLMPKKSPSKRKCAVPRYQPCHGQTAACVEKAKHIHVSNTPHGPTPEGLVQLDLLKRELDSKKNIVIISGAGISTNAGSKFQIMAPKWQCSDYNPR